jgi:DNA ligase (NAD+)
MKVQAGARRHRPEGGALAGRTYVLTGTLSAMTRDQASEAIESLGGQVTGSVSRRTTAVIVGEDAGSKARKAAELGVPTLDEAAFLELLAAAGYRRPPL